MRNFASSHLRLTFILSFLASAIIIACNSNTETVKEDDSSTSTNMSMDELIKRGDYLVTSGSCHDCHSPKIFTQHGPKVDSSKMLSGHPSNAPLPPIDKKALEPGYWYLLGPDLTTAVGPWGISYSANLTPDTATGLGNWTETNFINALRKGKHQGLDEGRPILPPMPWEYIAKMTDQDLKAIFAFLKSLPPVSNRVPAPVSPPDVAKMP